MDANWDLIVAGAGPAGCVLAAKAALGGARVLLLEQKKEPGLDRDWIVDVERHTFALAGVPEPHGEDLFTESRQTVLVTSDHAHAVELLPAPMVPVRNLPYVRRLADWAKTSGAEIRTETPVVGPVIEKNSVSGVLIREGTSETRLLAPVVADCTGISGTIRRGTPPAWGLAGLISPADIVLARRETRTIDPDGARRAMEKGVIWDGVRYDRVGSQGVYSVETFFLDIEAGFVDILIGVKPGSGPNPEERFEAILRERPFIGDKVFGDGGPIPIARPMDTFVADGLVCVGDSACQVIPAHGSGTASALIAADLASGVVLRAIESGRADRETLWGYSHAFQSSRGALLAYYDVIRNHTSTLSVDDLDLLIEKGMVSPREVYSGLVPEVPHLAPRDLLVRVPSALTIIPLLTGVAGAGLLARRTLTHYQRYPALDLPGTLERWQATMPAKKRL